MTLQLNGTPEQRTIGWVTQHSESKIELGLDSGAVVLLSLRGDCCSESFFDKESIDAARGLVGEQLVSIDERECGSAKGDRQKCASLHALVINTDKQSASLMWRNESNGYYDGHCSVEFRRLGVAS